VDGHRGEAGEGGCTIAASERQRLLASGRNPGAARPGTTLTPQALTPSTSPTSQPPTMSKLLWDDPQGAGGELRGGEGGRGLCVGQQCQQLQPRKLPNNSFPIPRTRAPSDSLTTARTQPRRHGRHCSATSRRCTATCWGRLPRRRRLVPERPCPKLHTPRSKQCNTIGFGPSHTKPHSTWEGTPTPTEPSPPPRAPCDCAIFNEQVHVWTGRVGVPNLCNAPGRPAGCASRGRLTLR
jgi:hypothetical protein